MTYRPNPNLIQPSFCLTLPDNPSRTESDLFAEVFQMVPWLKSTCSLRLWKKGFGWHYFEFRRQRVPRGERIFVRVAPLYTYYGKLQGYAFRWLEVTLTSNQMKQACTVGTRNLRANHLLQSRVCVLISPFSWRPLLSIKPTLSSATKAQESSSLDALKASGRMNEHEHGKETNNESDARPKSLVVQA